MYLASLYVSLLDLVVDGIEASLDVLGSLMTQKYRVSIIVLSISKSVEPNKEQKEKTSGFQ